MTSRSWCLTLNNYTSEEVDSLRELAKTWRYLIIGYEVGEKEETPHLQMYLELNSPKRFASLKKLMPRAHIASRRGTRDEARNYCMKEGKYEEIGTWISGQGARTDLDKVRQMSHEGMRVVTSVCNFQQIKVAEKYLMYNEEPRDFKGEVTWIYGESGHGKSKHARELVNLDDCYTKSEGSKWWCGYDNHEHVIIDDFRDSWWPITYMLRLLDRYECRVETKGGQRQFRPKNIIVTSIFKPSRMYNGTGECLKQLLRRIDKTIKMEEGIPCDEDCHEVGEVILDSP